MKNRYGLTVLTTILMLAVFFAAGTVSAATTATKVKGTLYSVNPAAHTVTLKSGGILTTITLSATTKFLRNGVATTLQGMVLGDRMTAVYKASLYPAKLKASGPAASLVQGKVTGISPDGTVHIGATSVKATVKTRIQRNGVVASLDSVASDDDVVAHVDDSTGEAEDIESEGPEEAEANGVITAVDTVGGTVTFQDAGGNSITVSVSDTTFIEVGDAAATLSDLTVGLLVEVHYDPATMAAYRIEAETEGEDTEVEGTITAVDLTAGTVTILDANGVSVTVIADAGTQIERDGEPAFLSDLVVGDSASAEYDINTLVANQIEAESPEVEDSSL